MMINLILKIQNIPIGVNKFKGLERENSILDRNFFRN